jgi:hypothetical protein
MEEKRNEVLVGKSKGRRLLARPRQRWEDHIRTDLQDIEWGAWICLIWPRIGTNGRLS